MTPLLLLHGALGAADMFTPLREELALSHEIHTLDFSGHGRALPADPPFSIPLFAADVLKYLEEKKLENISIFGYSMGGYVALYLAKNYPDKIKCVITLATKFHWDERTALKEAAMLNPDKIAAKVPQLATALQQRHSTTGWKDMLHQTADMLLSLGAEQPLTTACYAAIQQPVLLLLGDRDRMVSVEETVDTYKILPAGTMGMLPDTAHPLEQVNVRLLGIFIKLFI